MKRLLFFFTRNQFCLNYFKNYVERYGSLVEKFDLFLNSEDTQAKVKKYGIDTVPTLVLVNGNGDLLASWRSGKPPDKSIINIEIGLINAGLE